MSKNKTKQNNKDSRIFFWDLLKFISAIFMIFITLCDFALEHDALASKIDEDKIELVINLLYIFTPTIFLISMGAGIFIRKDNPTELLKRGLTFIIIGAIFNFILGLTNVLISFTDFDYVVHYLSDFSDEIFKSNVFYFAGIFYLFYSLVKQLKLKDWMVLIILVVVTVVGNLLISEFYISRSIIRMALGNFIYVNYDSNFCFTLWMIYPIIGILFESVFEIVENKKRFMGHIALIDIIVFVVLLVVFLSTDKFEERYLFFGENGFIMDYLTVIFVLGANLLYLSLMYYISCLLEKYKKINQGITFVSTNITKIYIIQAIILEYSIVIIKYFIKKEISYFIIVLLIYAVVCALSVFITLLINKLIKKHHDKKQAKLEVSAE